jgi:hypothetical protein
VPFRICVKSLNKIDVAFVLTTIGSLDGVLRGILTSYLYTYGLQLTLAHMCVLGSILFTYLHAYGLRLTLAHMCLMGSMLFTCLHARGFKKIVAGLLMQKGIVNGDGDGLRLAEPYTVCRLPFAL